MGYLWRYSSLCYVDITKGLIRLEKMTYTPELNDIGTTFIQDSWPREITLKF